MSDFKIGQLVHFTRPVSYSLTTHEKQFVGFYAGESEEEGYVWLGYLTAINHTSFLQDFQDFYKEEPFSFYSSVITTLLDNPDYFATPPEGFESSFNSLRQRKRVFSHMTVTFFAVRKAHLEVLNPDTHKGSLILNHYSHITHPMRELLLKFHQASLPLLGPRHLQPTILL